ncbi:hypothetical protein Enr13x_14450 [Stieleria neptunia]|uniref:YcxB-like protein domain-containing protein n=1 Tax=Stieleria neptunia TaxID=2527979 RepID=A0A518HL79_9BACT|nr:hypothetical protein [Stieleria neptunia]QDV41602.1 hypothetical protein Enr13x_14450 [Stieleria neptunia]
MTPNPYQAPPTDSLAAGQTPPPSHFVPGRLEFNGEVTRQHHRDAVIKAGIRTEYRNTTRVLIALAGMYALLVSVLVLASGDLDATNLLRTFLATAVLLAGVALFCRHQRWLVGTRVPSFQLALGPIRGWVDRDGLWIETGQSQAYWPLDKLVSCAATHELWVLSFAKEQTFWQTLPIDAFADPASARGVAADLQQAFPPRLPQLLDERKRTPPEAPCLFPMPEDAVAFEGEFYEDCARTTRLWKASKQAVVRTWFALAILLVSLLISIFVLTGFRTLYVALAALWCVFLVASIFVRVWRARRSARQTGRTIAWCSKGWLDDHGYCAMTSLSQTRATWQFFDHAEITDDVIGLYPHEDDVACCLVSREQFADADDWNRATELVRSKFVA